MTPCLLTLPETLVDAAHHHGAYHQTGATWGIKYFHIMPHYIYAHMCTWCWYFHIMPIMGTSILCPYYGYFHIMPIDSYVHSLAQSTRERVISFDAQQPSTGAL